jgi:hypothetical protein
MIAGVPAEIRTEPDQSVFMWSVGSFFLVRRIFWYSF